MRKQPFPRRTCDPAPMTWQCQATETGFSSGTTRTLICGTARRPRGAAPHSEAADYSHGSVCQNTVVKGDVAGFHAKAPSTNKKRNKSRAPSDSPWISRRHPRQSALVARWSTVALAAAAAAAALNLPTRLPPPPPLLLFSFFSSFFHTLVEAASTASPIPKAAACCNKPAPASENKSSAGSGLPSRLSTRARASRQAATPSRSHCWGEWNQPMRNVDYEPFGGVTLQRRA